MKEHCCENCKYHDDFTWVCSCPDSNNREDFTYNDSSCKFWEQVDDGRDDV